MRFIFLILFLAGGILAFGYPAAIEALSGRVIATQSLYGGQSTFQPADITLAADQAPVRIDVEIEMAGADAAAMPEYGGLTLQVTRAGEPVLDSSLDIRAFEIVSGQSATLLRAVAGVIDSFPSGSYRFEMAGRGEVTSGVTQISVILRANALRADKRAVPMGYVLMALGLIGFVMSMRRGRTPQAVATRRNPRWGRGAGD